MERSSSRGDCPEGQVTNRSCAKKNTGDVIADL